MEGSRGWLAIVSTHPALPYSEISDGNEWETLFISGVRGAHVHMYLLVPHCNVQYSPGGDSAKFSTTLTLRKVQIVKRKHLI